MFEYANNIIKNDHKMLKHASNMLKHGRKMVTAC